MRCNHETGDFFGNHPFFRMGCFWCGFFAGAIVGVLAFVALSSVLDVGAIGALDADTARDGDTGRRLEEVGGRISDGIGAIEGGNRELETILEEIRAQNHLLEGDGGNLRGDGADTCRQK